MRLGPRGSACVALLVLPVALGRTALAGEPIDRVEVTVVTGSAPCPAPLRAVVAEQLADVAPDLVWVCRERIDPEEPFRSDAAGAIRVAIELRAAAEARLTLGDTRSDRFVVRRVPLRNGLDELGREQLGQIVRFATLALRDGSEQTLSRTEARAAVASWPASAPPAPRREASPLPVDGAPRGPGWAVDVGPIWSVSIFSREIPLVQELAVGAALGGLASAAWGWVEAGYRPPASDHARPIGVELSAASLRLGLAAGQARARALSFSGGVGVGFARVSFTPIGAAPSVQAADPDAFWSISARLMLSGDWRPTSRLTVGVRLVCDFAAADVHYDLRGSDGSAHRVLTAFRVAPGVGLSVAWRL